MQQIPLFQTISIALISGTLVYTIWSIINYIFSTNTKTREISQNSLYASLVYFVSIMVLYFLRTDLILSIILISITCALKFFIEERMLAYLEYGEIKCQVLCYVMIVVILVEIALKVLNIIQVNLYLFLLITINLLMVIGWLKEKNVRILGIMNIISIVFLISISDKNLALILSLIPYGFNSIFINSKDYTNTVSSLFIIKQYGETILEEQIEEYNDFVYLLISKVESRYSIRNMHSINVRAISEGIALEMKLDPKIISYISDASMIHDIGYLGIDHRKITQEPSEENPENLRHIWIGKYILENSNIFIKYLPVVLYHHENLNGSGPEKLKSEYIPLAARIVRVADVFERLINGRDGKRYTIKETLSYIRKNKGTLFDPNVVDALERYVYKRY